MVQSEDKVFISGRKEHASSEEACAAHNGGANAVLQRHCVSCIQPKHSVPRNQVVTSLIPPETVHHHCVVMPQLYVSTFDEGDAQEAELVNTGDDTGEQARARVVVVLFVVYDQTEMNGFGIGRIGLSQTDREGGKRMGGISDGC